MIHVISVVTWNYERHLHTLALIVNVNSYVILHMIWLFFVFFYLAIVLVWTFSQCETVLNLSIFFLVEWSIYIISSLGMHPDVSLMKTHQITRRSAPASLRPKIDIFHKSGGSLPGVEHKPKTIKEAHTTISNQWINLSKS